MLTIKKLQENLQKQVKFKISQVEIAKALGTTKANVSLRIKNESKVKLEEVKKIIEYFNLPHSNTILNEIVAESVYNFSKDIKSTESINNTNTDDCIILDHVLLKPSCGKGTIQEEEAEIKPIKLGLTLINDILKVANPNLLKTFTANGDSMTPTIEDGDLLLIDMGRTEYQNGGIFLMTINNDWFIKRLRLRITGELDIISDNEKYPIETLTPDTYKEVSIKGRVVKNLSRGL